MRLKASLRAPCCENERKGTHQQQRQQIAFVYMRSNISVIDLFPNTTIFQLCSLHELHGEYPVYFLAYIMLEIPVRSMTLITLHATFPDNTTQSLHQVYHHAEFLSVSKQAPFFFYPQPSCSALTLQEPGACIIKQQCVGRCNEIFGGTPQDVVKFNTCLFKVTQVGMLLLASFK